MTQPEKPPSAAWLRPSVCVGICTLWAAAAQLLISLESAERLAPIYGWMFAVSILLLGCEGKDGRD